MAHAKADVQIDKSVEEEKQPYHQQVPFDE